MSFFNTIFGSKPNDDASSLNWNPLSELSQLETIIESSKTKTQLIFKHSTRCGISRAVLKQFEKKDIDSTTTDLYYLDLLSYREISNELAQKFNVIHQSPQLLVIKDGKVTAHDSHYDLLSVEI